MLNVLSLFFSRSVDLLTSQLSGGGGPDTNAYRMNGNGGTNGGGGGNGSNGPDNENSGGADNGDDDNAGEETDATAGSGTPGLFISAFFSVCPFLHPVKGIFETQEAG